MTGWITICDTCERGNCETHGLVPADGKVFAALPGRAAEAARLVAEPGGPR